MSLVEHEVTLHVSIHGSDQNAGAIDHPLATLRGVRNRLRQLRLTRPLTHGATVLIHAGDYSFDESLELTAEDSGASPEHPIVYRAAPGETVRLLGGKRVTDWRPVSDASVLNRLTLGVRSLVLEADLKAAGIAQPAPLVSRGFARKTPPAHSELFFDNRPMSLARWPNADDKSGDAHLPGWRRIASFPSSGSNDGHGQMLGKLEDGFFYEGDRPKNWATSDDIWVHGYWAYDWANSYERIVEFDKERCFIKTADPHGLYGFAKGQKFYFLNVLEELNTPGEYFVDRQRGKIYFYPPAPIAASESIVSTLGTPLISMNGVSNIVVRGPGLSIECTRGYGVEINGGSHCLIAGIAILNTGSYGVQVKGGTNHGVRSCDISNTGDGGVAIHGGDRKTLTPANHFVDNCHFHHQARWSRCYHPCVLMTGVGARVTNNVMHDHPHCPVLFNGNDHLVEGNEIYSACWETGDVGGIYMGRDYTERGNVIRHNYLHHLGGIGLGSFAVYLDDCASGTTVVGNLFHQTNMAVLIGGGRDNTVENNIVVDSVLGVQLDGRGVSTTKIWHDMVYVTMQDRFNEMKAAQPPYSTRYPALADLPALFAKNDGVPGENTRLMRNVSVGGQWLLVTWGGKQEWAHEEANLVSAAPGFENAAHPELSMFKLRADSPALKLGHRAIPVESIGLKRDEYRIAWPRVTTLLDWTPDAIAIGKPPSGVLHVTLVNQGTGPWTGTFTVIATPAESVKFAAPTSVSATIAPGATTTHDLRLVCTGSVVDLEVVAQDAIFPGVRPARVKLRFPLPIGRHSKNVGLADVTALLASTPAREVAGGGANLGTVRFAVAGSDLAILARVIDTAPIRRDASPWEGSCIEVFGSMEGTEGAPKIGQLYLMPSADGKSDAASLEKSGKREPTDRIRIKTARLDDGYELAALVPLDLLAITPTSQNFLLEFIINSAATPGAGAKRSSMFGSTTPYNNTNRFSRVTLVTV